jgi:hypothetical protein
VSASQALRQDLEGRPDRAGRAPSDVPFAVYVEGPRDREILRAWAWRLSAAFSEVLIDAAVILGGRQPARAAQHFRELRATAAHARGICILDRDDTPVETPGPHEPGLEYYTWRRRHIESYLLVPRAILRGAGLAPRDARLQRIVEHHLPEPADEDALRDLNAKALLAGSGPLARALGRPLPPGRIARAMERDELHGDVLDLLGRVESARRAAGDEGAANGGSVPPCLPPPGLG